eukprot:746291_1
MSNCKQFNCRCTIYVEGTSKWSKGKCKTCQHKQQQHGNVFKAIAKKQSNQTDASSVTPNVSNKKNQNLSLSKVTMSAKSINIPIKIEELRDSADKIDESIDIKAMYSSTTTIQDILDKIDESIDIKAMVENGYFVQYTSTTWDKNVALQFLGDQKGIILEFDKVFRYDADIFCCDVSWISKFEDECEILFARSSRNSWDHNNFSFEIVDQQKGIQTVSVSYSKHAQ